MSILPSLFSPFVSILRIFPIYYFSSFRLVKLRYATTKVREKQNIPERHIGMGQKPFWPAYQQLCSNSSIYQQLFLLDVDLVSIKLKKNNNNALYLMYLLNCEEFVSKCFTFIHSKRIKINTRLLRRSVRKYVQNKKKGVIIYREGWWSHTMAILGE